MFISAKKHSYLGQGERTALDIIKVHDKRRAQSRREPEGPLIVQGQSERGKEGKRTLIVKGKRERGKEGKRERGH